MELQSHLLSTLHIVLVCLFVCCLLLFKAAVGRVETGPPAAQAGLGLPCHHTWFVVLSHTEEETEVALT